MDVHYNLHVKGAPTLNKMLFVFTLHHEYLLVFQYHVWFIVWGYCICFLWVFHGLEPRYLERGTQITLFEVLFSEF
jgi:hypothetical protein